ncbi:MAG: tRNA 2-thiouridine(34) synthase MnmA [Paludibacteraceae bacterium]|nr:tRNA 2-thiouridine(34) synthase MnmA [Paludibacteraceae bacterium]
MAKRVLIAMSGGIDSTVSALLLKEQGYELVGVTFRTFDSIKESCIAKEKGCCSIESIMEAKHNAEKMGFEHHIVDFRDTFREHVIKNFVDEYAHGRTPNPCVLCNSHIKWGALLEAAREYGCEKIATGHYARIAEHGGHRYLRTAADTLKDQTYFLWMLTEANLERTLFPLGDLTKDEVRRIAAEHGYDALVKKPESQEVCFIPDNDYRGFLAKEGVPPEPGDYIDADGKVVGQHQGCPFYTIGQRKGLGVALGYPAFVTDIDTGTNRISLGHHDDLLTDIVRVRDLRIRDIQWLTDLPQVEARIRYRSQATPASLTIDAENKAATLQFDSPVWAPTPGQSVVLYKDNLVVGGGIIERQ